MKNVYLWKRGEYSLQIHIDSEGAMVKMYLGKKKATISRDQIKDCFRRADTEKDRVKELCFEVWLKLNCDYHECPLIDCLWLSWSEARIIPHERFDPKKEYRDTYRERVISKGFTEKQKPKKKEEPKKREKSVNKLF